MYTTIVHPLRKMYNMSINEYCVLEAVHNLSNNTKYDGWCVLSFEKIAAALDLSRPTVIRAFKKLEGTSLIEKRRQTKQDTAVRTCDEWNEWFMPEKAHLLVGMKTNNNEIVGIIPKPGSDGDTTSIKLTPDQYQNDTATSIKMIPNTNKDTNNNITTTGVDKKLIKWLKGMEDVSSPKGLASTYLKRYDWRAIDKALGNLCCTSRSKFTELCEHYGNI